MTTHPKEIWLDGMGKRCICISGFSRRTGSRTSSNEEGLSDLAPRGATKEEIE